MSQTCGNCRCLGTLKTDGEDKYICMLNPPVHVGNNTEARVGGGQDCWPVWAWPETNKESGWCSHWAPNHLMNYTPPRGER